MTGPILPAPRFARHPHRGAAVLALIFTVSVLLILAVSGCSRQRVNVKLAAQAHEKIVPLRVNVRAEVSGQTSLLNYKWFADSGKCDPQESAVPQTVFSFALNSARDTVTLEVWEKSERVGQATIQLTKEQFSQSMSKATGDEYRITITEIPPAGTGGANTRANISGTVSGDVSNDLRVLVYARSRGAWYIQPLSQSFHMVADDQTWKTWTHTGSDYAAILVLPDHIASRVLDSIPEVNDHILARVVVGGSVPKASGRE